MDAIVYTSNAGTTAHYAEILAKETGLPVFEMKKAQEVTPGADIIYLGWLMAGQVKEYTKAAQRWNVRMVCGVGMAANGSQVEDVRKTNKIAENIPVFTLQGGFNITKLHGLYKLMMVIMKKTAGKALEKKEDKTPEEEDMYNMLMNGGDCVCVENLQDVLECLKMENKDV